MTEFSFLQCPFCIQFKVENYKFRMKYLGWEVIILHKSPSNNKATFPSSALDILSTSIQTHIFPGCPVMWLLQLRLAR